MLLIVGYNNEIAFATGNTYHQIEVLNRLTNIFQSLFFYAEGFWYIIYTYHSIVVN